MLINGANLEALRVGFKQNFQDGVARASTQHARVATVVPSTSQEQKYAWLGSLPAVREWVGPRAVQNLMAHDYAIREKVLELTIGVDRDHVETDNIGIYAPLMTAMGQSTGAQWDLMVFAQLKAGFDTVCYDGQNFFDTDHPVLDEDGVAVMVSNTGGGSGTPWFLLDVSRPLKPVILQKRKEFEFVSLDRPTDGSVFWNREFVYGADARANTGFGFWQMAYGSKDTLSAANYAAARAAIMGCKGDHGRPLGLMPDLLVVPPALEGAARKLLNSEYASGGETNEWKGTAELLVVPWLA